MRARNSPATTVRGDRAGVENAGGGFDVTSMHDATDTIARLDEAHARRLTQQIKLLADSTWRQLSRLKDLVDEAQTGQVHLVLGYPSWTAYLADVLGDLHLHLDRDDRRDLVGYLSGRGMSSRAIASAVGISKNTVTADLQLSQSGTPAGAIDPAQFFTDEAEMKSSLAMADLSEQSFDDVLTAARAEGELSRANVVKHITTDATAATKKITGIDGKVYSRSEPSKSHRRRPLPDSYRDAIWKLFKLAETIERLHKDDRLAAHAETLLQRHRSELLRAHKSITAICADLGVDTGAEPPICRDCGDKLVLGPESRLRELAAARAVRHAADGGQT